MSSPNGTQSESKLSFLDHLEELRWRLVKSTLAIVFMGVFAFIFHRFIFDVIILGPRSPEFLTNVLMCKLADFLAIPGMCINSKPFEIISITMAGQFSAHIYSSLVGGLILAFPYVFQQFWLFVKPALHKHEKGYARSVIFYSSLLFFVGVLFGYYIILPLSIHFLGSYEVSSQVINQINLNSYISTFLSVLLASGVVFELPIVIYFLSKVGLVTPSFMRTYRKHAYVLVLVLAAIITPPDVFSQILVSIPLIILYEISIGISGRVARKDPSLLD